MITAMVSIALLCLGFGPGVTAPAAVVAMIADDRMGAAIQIGRKR